MGVVRSGSVRRVLLFVPLAAAAAAALAVVALGIGGGADRPTLNADPIEPPREAPLTEGVGADGEPVSLPRDGRPAVVTFLFASCPTVCPLISQQIATALERLGPDASRVDVLAVSVDPSGDTPAVVRRYLRGHGLEGKMRYLVGERPDLEPIWDAWQVGAQPPGRETLSLHSARVVLVDDAGRQVGKYSGGLPIKPRHIAEDVRALL